MSHYQRTNRPKLLGDDVAQPIAPLAPKKSMAIMDEPIVKNGIAAAGVYHGYKRTGSLLWGLVYGVAARVAPVVTGAVVVAQGFGQKKGS